MPRVRRRPKERRYGRDNLRTLLLLSTGHDWYPLVDGEEESDLAGIWEEMRDYVLDLHLHGSEDCSDFTFSPQPFSRPWAWWRFDAPEPRRQLRPGPEPVGPIEWFGRPRGYLGMPPDDMFETEREYLTRLDLLTEEERSQC
jgi:hypothetical protein